MRGWLYLDTYLIITVVFVGYTDIYTIFRRANWLKVGDFRGLKPAVLTFCANRCSEGYVDPRTVGCL
jgi:hypothetical protein